MADTNDENLPSALPTLREVIESALGFRLPGLPALPQTVKNLDKVGAALLDVPTAHLEGKAAGIRGETGRRDRLEGAVVDAMRRQLKDASDEKVAAAVDGMVIDYLEKRSRRARVFEIAAEEIERAPPSEEAKKPVDDDWMAFFKGKVDQLGTEEARFLFGKILAGEVKQPGSFSKRTLSILTEMGPEVGAIFERLCNVSMVTFPSGNDVRVVTLGMGPVGRNSLQEFGLPFEAFIRLNDAGLVISDFNTEIQLSFILGRQFDLGGSFYRQHVGEARKMELDTPDKRAAALGAAPGVAFTAAGRELRSIVSMKATPAYIEKLAKGFTEKGFDLQKA